MNKYLGYILFVVSLICLFITVGIIVVDGTDMNEFSAALTVVLGVLSILLPFILWKNNFFKRND